MAGGRRGDFALAAALGLTTTNLKTIGGIE
jgi:hypothetical protein